MAGRAGSKLVASMPHADGAVAAGLAGCALIVVMITTQTCFAALFPLHFKLPVAANQKFDYGKNH